MDYPDLSITERYNLGSRLIRRIYFLTAAFLTFINLRHNSKRRMAITVAPYVYSCVPQLRTRRSRKIPTQHSTAIIEALSSYCLANQQYFKDQHIAAVFLGGSVAEGIATPFSTLIMNKPLPDHVYLLLYLWNQFLIRRGTALQTGSDLDLRLFLAAPTVRDPDELIHSLREFFQTRLGFAPDIEFRTHTDPSSLIRLALTSRTVYISRKCEDIILDDAKAIKLSDIQRWLPKRLEAPLKRKHTKHRHFHDLEALFWKTFETRKNGVALDNIDLEDGTTAVLNTLLDSNKPVFMGDITKSIGDGKTNPKNPGPTILLTEDARNEKRVAMKIRGCSEQKTSLLHLLDLIREFYITTHLFKVSSKKLRDHLIQPYGILINCQNMRLREYHISEGAVGLMMQPIILSENQLATTLRITGLSRPWHIRHHVRRSRNQLRQRSTTPSLAALCLFWARLYALLLYFNLDITECDLMFIHDKEGKIVDFLLLDFEKTSFRCLFLESHGIIDFLIDYHQRLDKRGPQRHLFAEIVERETHTSTLLDSVTAGPHPSNLFLNFSGNSLFRLCSFIWRSICLFPISRYLFKL
jgi:hypothetical protein